jgi:hypothetical protein
LSFLYRTAVVLKRKQPYLDWANGLGDDGPELDPELAEARMIYLAPESEDETASNVATILEEFWRQIFEEELASWMIDDATWPTPLTRELFDAWFDIEVIDSVCDLTPEEPLTQGDVEALELDEALHRCSWCDIAVEEGEGHFVGFTLADRSSFIHREGLVVPVRIDDERVVIGVMSRADSEWARNGEDFLFRACTSRCEKALRSAIPKALRKMRRST